MAERRFSIIATGAVLSILPAIAVFLRFYCHLRVTRSKLAIDDWLMLGAFILTLGLGIMLIVGGALYGLAEPTPEGWAKTDYVWVTNNAEITTEKVANFISTIQSWFAGI
ncbi:hypothetical protein BD289DRAFT_486871 [Coniella lustricola]|uniref:Uncharacterized protein n=1 Tax=Coniella lustricola TaxID=2025994 RepID=A0A2T2ZTN3_9PEZI|nr:hypothetical protein BD289DRAFT_486871 [Coniella lustricola]